MPLISMTMPVFNGARTIGKSIESGLAQTIKDIEIVVVDDCSTDDTAAVVQSYIDKDPRVRLVKLEKNLGGGGASNVAIENARGEWIAILDADDWFEPERLERLLKVANDMGADSVCDNLRIYDHVLGEVVDVMRHGLRDRPMVIDTETYIRRDSPLQRHSLGYIQPMTRKKFLTDKNVKYDPNHRYGYDFIFVAEILLNGGKLVIVPEAYYTYVHRISPTTRKRSPHSRSEAGHNLIVRGCNEILEKYKDKMTDRERTALIHRRKIFENRLYCDDMLYALYDGHVFKATGILLAHPFILVLIFVTIIKMLYARLLAYWGAVRRFFGLPSYGG